MVCRPLVDSTSAQQEVLFQKSATDWDFILARAAFNGFIMALDDDKITIGKPEFSGSAVLAVGYGDGPHLFRCGAECRKAAARIEAAAWDLANTGPDHIKCNRTDLKYTWQSYRQIILRKTVTGRPEAYFQYTSCTGRSEVMGRQHIAAAAHECDERNGFLHWQRSSQTRKTAGIGGCRRTF